MSRRPVEHDPDLVAEADQLSEVQRAPHEPGDEAREPNPQQAHRSELVTNADQLAEVQVLEGSLRRAAYAPSFLPFGHLVGMRPGQAEAEGVRPCPERWRSHRARTRSGAREPDNRLRPPHARPDPIAVRCVPSMVRRQRQRTNKRCAPRALDVSAWLLRDHPARDEEYQTGQESDRYRELLG